MIRETFPGKGITLRPPMTLMMKAYVPSMLLLASAVAPASCWNFPLTPSAPSAAELALSKELAQRERMLGESHRLKTQLTHELARERTGAVAADLVRICAPLDRGNLATVNDIAAIESAVESLESVAPCRAGGNELIKLLSEKWQLVFSSSLAQAAAKRRDSGLVRLPTARIGAVAQIISGGVGEEAKLEDQIEILLPAPWPLPEVELLTKFSHELEAKEAGKHAIRLKQVDLLRAASGTAGVTLPGPGKLPSQVRSLLSSLPPAERLASFESKASALECTALHLHGSTRVRVVRSDLGELCVYVAEGGSRPRLEEGYEGAKLRAAAEGGGGFSRRPALAAPSSEAPSAGGELKEEAFEEELWTEGSDWGDEMWGV